MVSVGRVFPRHRHRGRPLNWVVRRHMVFALDRDNGGLLALSSPVETDVQCKRMVVEIIEDNAYKTSKGWFSNWYTNVKKDLGM